MKIVDAVWEKRNLGLMCQELKIEPEDCAPAVQEAVRSMRGDYLVVSLPEGRMDFHSIMLAEGFVFAETLIDLAWKGADVALTAKQRSLLPHLDYTINTPGLRERVACAIQNGMFSTDRISLDPHFSAQDTARRYLGMVEDSLTRGAELLEVTYDGKPAAFDCFIQQPEVGLRSLLGGTYHEYRGGGLGFSIFYFLQKEAVAHGLDGVVASVSSNNMPSLHVHTQIGLLPKACRYIFVKHDSTKEDEPAI